MSTKIMTYLTYDEVYCEKGSKFIRKKDLLNPTFVEREIINRLKTLNPVECIQFLSFLNMIYHTNDIDDLSKIFKREIEQLHLHKKQIKFNWTTKVLFHKWNLLYLIQTIIKNNLNGNRKITGLSDIGASKLFYETLLLANNLIDTLPEDKTIAVIKQMIRDDPPTYIKANWVNTFELRIERYSLLLNKFLTKYSSLKKSSDSLFKEIGVPREIFFDEVNGLFLRFGQLSNYEKDKKIGFQNNNIGSFYVNTENFGKDDPKIKLIDFYSLDLAEFRKDYKNNDKSLLKDNYYYEYLPGLFSKPAFKIIENVYCIIDIVFFIEKICNGFIFSLVNEEFDFPTLKQSWGKIVEDYFSEIIKKILPNIVITGSEKGEQDAIYEDGENIVIFEFTTENFSINTLYSNTDELFKKDIEKILLHPGKIGIKKDKGKFFKLNNYINPYTQFQKNILPVLVTEKYIGDYDLLNYEINFLSNKIFELGLENIIKHKPMIICLDDLDFAVKNEILGPKFVDNLNKWKNCNNKNNYHYNFRYFLSATN